MIILQDPPISLLNSYIVSVTGSQLATQYNWPWPGSKGTPFQVVGDDNFMLTAHIMITNITFRNLNKLNR